MPVTKDQIELLKKLKDNNYERYEEELEKLKQDLFSKYCSKTSYKKECEAAYCADAHTDTCQYLHEMRKLDQELDIWSR